MKGKRGTHLGQTLTVICIITQNGQLWTSVLLSPLHSNKYACFHTWCQRARLKLPDHMTEFSLKIGSIGVLQCHEHVLHINNPVTLSIKLTKGLKCTKGRGDFSVCTFDYTNIRTQRRRQTKKSHAAASLYSSLKPAVYVTYINTLKPACNSFVKQMKESWLNQERHKKYHSSTMFWICLRIPCKYHST